MKIDLFLFILPPHHSYGSFYAYHESNSIKSHLSRNLIATTDVII